MAYNMGRGIVGRYPSLIANITGAYILYPQIQDEKDPDKLEEIRKSNFSIAKRYDVICRGLFPLAFIIFNITFWAYYLNTKYDRYY